MPTPHQVIAALGSTGTQALLRAALQVRNIYFIPNSEAPTNFTAVDPILGSIPPVIAYNGSLFWFDAADTTSVHDGVTVLVSNDGKRYKLALAINSLSVLDKDLTAPPGSPTIGQNYLVPAAATGAWATHDKSIAHFTSRGWEFELPKIGDIIYVEDEDAFYHYSAAGAWVAGFGDSSLSVNSVLPTTLLGGKVTWVVENQTTNAPPGSPAVGDQYIIGPVPTGAWAGNAGKLTMRNAANTAWIIVTPTEGYKAYDKTVNADFVYNGSAWVSNLGVYTSRYQDLFNASAAQSVEDAGNSGLGASSGYVYSSTVGPTSTTVGRVIEQYQPSITAKAAAAYFELEYWARCTIGAAINNGAAASSITLAAIAIFKDTDATPLDWWIVDSLVTFSTTIGATSSELIIKKHKFLFTLGDTAAHVLKIRFFFRNTGGASTGIQVSAFNILHRRVIIREAA